MTTTQLTPPTLQQQAQSAVRQISLVNEERGNAVKQLTRNQQDAFFWFLFGQLLQANEARINDMVDTATEFAKESAL